MTVTLAAPKIPLILPPADSHCGDLVIADIGIPLPILDDIEGPHIEILTRERMRELVPARAADSHKGDFGRVLVIAGSFGRSGAAHLAATRRAAIGRRPRDHCDAALVRRRSIAAMAPEYMTEPLDETPTGTIDYAALDRVLDIKADVIAVGPGLGQSPGTAAFVQGLLERAGVPLVLDADALNAFAGEPDRLVGRDGVDVIITPHPGEMARLLNISVEAVQRDRLRHATRVCRQPPPARHPQGASHGDRGSGQSRLHQPHWQFRDGDRRHRRSAHRHGGRVVCPAARRRSRVQACGLPARHAPAIWPRPTKAKLRSSPATWRRGSGMPSWS